MILFMKVVGQAMETRVNTHCALHYKIFFLITQNCIMRNLKNGKKMITAICHFNSASNGQKSLIDCYRLNSSFVKLRGLFKMRTSSLMVLFFESQALYSNIDFTRYWHEYRNCKRLRYFFVPFSLEVGMCSARAAVFPATASCVMLFFPCCFRIWNETLHLFPILRMRCATISMVEHAGYLLAVYDNDCSIRSRTELTANYTL